MIPGSAIPLLLATAGPTFNPRSYFDVKLYTGNGSTQTISGLNFSPDLVWIKNRGGANNHAIYDVQRGAYVQMQTNLPYEDQNFNPYGVTAFNSDGFGLNDLSNGGYNLNGSSMSYVAWTWDAGSSTVTNTQGSITSQVRANASAGFSVVTYTGNGTDGATVGHGLGVTPGMVIVKRRDVAQDWVVAHSGITLSTQSLALNLTTSATSFGDGWIDAWSSTTFTTNQGASSIVNVNANTGTYVAYCWSPVAGYSSFGSYTGNGSATGPVISGLGFQPYFVMIKASSTTGDWWMYDGARSPSNPRINKFKANTPGAEDTAGEDVDFQLDGFQIKTSDSGLNQNAATYIYAAFA
jgi:hypothetical protein